METLLFVIIVLLCALLYVAIITHMDLNSILKHALPPDVHGVAEEHEIVPDENLERERMREELTDYEIERLEREAEFDLRIKKMKEELAMEHGYVPRKGTIAAELHPDVHNLPHDAVDMRYGLPDVEYVE